jgi:hypothetical protein
MINKCKSTDARRLLSVKGHLKSNARLGDRGPRRNWKWQGAHYLHSQAFWRRGITSCHAEEKILPKSFGRLLTAAVTIAWD